MLSADGTKVFYLGIIDVFTHYNFKKKAEHFVKSIQYDNYSISCVPPDVYADRFQKYMCDKVLK